MAQVRLVRDAPNSWGALFDGADKYKGNAAAADTLVAKLKEGKGHPKANASDAELKTLVGFVLAGGK